MLRPVVSEARLPVVILRLRLSRVQNYYAYFTEMQKHRLVPYGAVTANSCRPQVSDQLVRCELGLRSLCRVQTPGAESHKTLVDVVAKHG